MEPENTAKQVSQWGLDYIVLTSVDRDDLEDAGSKHIADTIRAIKVISEPKLIVFNNYSGSSEVIFSIVTWYKTMFFTRHNYVYNF